MNNNLFQMKSYTQAMLARKSLSEYRIKSVIEKTSTKSGGCAFRLRVYGDVEKAAHILDKKGFQNSSRY